MGVLKKSLHTWHRNAFSTAARATRGVESQSVESGRYCSAMKESVKVNGGDPGATLAWYVQEKE